MVAHEITAKSLASLKAILERENGRFYSPDEVERIGRGLISLYADLADNELNIGFPKPSSENRSKISRDIT